MRLLAKRMVKVEFSNFFGNMRGLRHILYVLILLFIPAKAYTQEAVVAKKGYKIIKILNADVDRILKDKVTGKDIHHLIGNVEFSHNDIKMSCDSAHYAGDKNQLTAFSKVHIEQGDTLDLYGNHLFYDGMSEIAIVTGNVELIDKDTHLYTDVINYDVKNKIARYNDKGRITNADNTLTSIIGIYYVSESLFHFKDSVKIVNPDYIMTADTMNYNTQSETAYFLGPTELNGDSLYLECERGWYDTKMKVTSIWKNALIDNRKQIVHGDSLFFNDSTGYGEAFRNVIIEDSVNNLIVKGNYAWYFKAPESFLVTNRAEFIQVSNNDSLFMHADTITAITVSDTTVKGYRLMRAYHGTRIFSKNFQAKCDSLSYSFQDSVIRLYTLPVIWSEENQLTSDSMAIFTKNRQTDRLELYNSAFVVSQVDTIRFNQIKGRSLTGFFKNNALFKIEIKGNGESVYYLLDGESVAGVNQSKCANIDALVNKGKITEISDTGSPDGFIDPPDIPQPVKIRLLGFNWFDGIRPKKKEDIFQK